jgi:hypothetical protein
MTTTTTTTYTVIDPSDRVMERGLSLDEAARAILTYDGREFEIRPARGGCSELWVRNAARSWPWNLTFIFSTARGAKAQRAIYQSVVESDWPGHPTAMPDERAREIYDDEGYAREIDVEEG